jgi:GNAT superfamily N-acetyltransferase
MQFIIRRLATSDALDAARIHRAAFDDRLPWLTGLHTPDEDARFYNDVVLSSSEVWGGFEGEQLMGFVAFRDGWIDQFYVAPDRQAHGLGSRLLDKAKTDQTLLRLWTFQRNTLARRFYENKGFVEIDRTDGARNEEKEPDILYEWRRSNEGIANLT